MAHDHAHDTDTYYLDQLCMLGITAAFAGVCLTLYFFNTGMLQLLLQDQFHPMILAAGIALAIVTLVRAVVLWKAAGVQTAGHVHDHAHEHHHDHDHGHDHHHHEHGIQDHSHHHHEHGEHCDHGHEHGQHHHEHGEHCDHHHDEHVKAGTVPAPSPALHSLPVVEHAHGHSHDDHDHGWAPLRYVVLLVPMMLYLLGLPSKAMPLGTAGVVDVGREAAQAARLIGMPGMPLQQASFAGAMLLFVDDHVVPIYVDGEQSSMAKLQPGMKVWLKLVSDSKVVGNTGTSAVWAATSSGSPPTSQGWTPKGVVKEVNTKENTLTVADSVDAQSSQTYDLEGTVFIDYKQLEQVAFGEKTRREFENKKIQVVGQFVPYSSTKKVFSVARLRIQCCGADAIQLNVPIYSKEDITAFQKEDWIRVTGRIEFRQLPNRPGIYQTVLIVNRADNVVKTAAEKPYIN